MPIVKVHEGPHKYQRVTLGQKGTYEVYKCMLPDCAHYVQAQLAVGRLSLCWGGCGNNVLLDQDAVGDRKVWRPMCDDCREERKLQRESLREIPEME